MALQGLTDHPPPSPSLSSEPETKRVHSSSSEGMIYADACTPVLLHPDVLARFMHRTAHAECCCRGKLLAVLRVGSPVPSDLQTLRYSMESGGWCDPRQPLSARMQRYYDDGSRRKTRPATTETAIAINAQLQMQSQTPLPAYAPYTPMEYMNSTDGRTETRRCDINRMQEEEEEEEEEQQQQQQQHADGDVQSQYLLPNAAASLHLHRSPTQYYEVVALIIPEQGGAPDDESPEEEGMLCTYAQAAFPPIAWSELMCVGCIHNQWFFDQVEHSREQCQLAEYFCINMVSATISPQLVAFLRVPSQQAMDTVFEEGKPQLVSVAGPTHCYVSRAINTVVVDAGSEHFKNFFAPAPAPASTPASLTPLPLPSVQSVVAATAQLVGVPLREVDHDFTFYQEKYAQYAVDKRDSFLPLPPAPRDDPAFPAETLRRQDCAICGKKTSPHDVSLTDRVRTELIDGRYFVESALQDEMLRLHPTCSMQLFQLNAKRTPSASYTRLQTLRARIRSIYEAKSVRLPSVPSVPSHEDALAVTAAVQDDALAEA